MYIGKREKKTKKIAFRNSTPPQIKEKIYM